MKAQLTALVLLATATVAHAQWKYEHVKNDLTDARIGFAVVTSRNQHKLAFPYQGGTKATLSVVAGAQPLEPRFLLEVNRGQLLCGPGECDVTVRFDDGPLLSYTAHPPEDMSSNYLWLVPDSEFVDQMGKAKRLRVSLMFFQNGSLVFDFRIAGLKWPQRSE